MSIKQEIPGEAEARAALEPLWQAAIAKRNEIAQRVPRKRQTMSDGWMTPAADADPEWAEAQREVARISDEQDAARRSYFRLNIWGMGSYRDAMLAVGMGYWDDMPDWPEPDSYGITREQYWAWDSPEHYPDVVLTDADREAAERFKADIEAVKSAHPSETPGIPLNKFCSNDGWHVTPVECSSALQLFGEFILGGYRTENDSLTWRDALALYKTADDAERRIIAANAFHAARVPAAPAGHPPYGAQEDTRRTTTEVIAEPYFLQWLTYLDDASRFGGFEVW